ncbi:MAG: STAS domain-containing protein [Clostridia bacterium]|nr:STAS domain-containing protein [Clostridia bacterium]
MTINIKENDKEIIIELAGRLDTTTAPELESAVKALPENIESLIIDMNGIEYISSAGLRVLLATHKKMGDGNFKLTNVCDSVMEVFDMTGFDDILVIE